MPSIVVIDFFFPENRVFNGMETFVKNFGLVFMIFLNSKW